MRALLMEAPARARARGRRAPSSKPPIISLTGRPSAASSRAAFCRAVAGRAPAVDDEQGVAAATSASANGRTSSLRRAGGRPRRSPASGRRAARSRGRRRSRARRRRRRRRSRRRGGRRSGEGGQHRRGGVPRRQPRRTYTVSVTETTSTDTIPTCPTTASRASAFEGLAPFELGVAAEVSRSRGLSWAPSAGTSSRSARPAGPAAGRRRVRRSSLRTGSRRSGARTP